MSVCMGEIVCEERTPWGNAPRREGWCACVCECLHETCQISEAYLAILMGFCALSLSDVCFGREGKMVVLSLAIGLAEQDDFANLPDLQEAPAGDRK